MARAARGATIRPPGTLTPRALVPGLESARSRHLRGSFPTTCTALRVRPGRSTPLIQRRPALLLPIFLGASIQLPRWLEAVETLLDFVCFQFPMHKLQQDPLCLPHGVVTPYDISVPDTIHEGEQNLCIRTCHRPSSAGVSTAIGQLSFRTIQ